MRLAAVVVDWNRLDLTLRCLESIESGYRVPEWLVVVDNGSRADPTSALKARFPRAEVLRHSVNAGFAAGANAGMERALQLGAEGVFLVNNDAVVAPGCLGELERALEADAGLAAVGGKVLTEDEPPRIHFAYGVLTFHGEVAQRRGWLDPDPNAYGECRDVDYVSGCAMLLRRTALERVGLFDPEYFAYHEDLDWCTRAWRAGFRIRYVPTAVVRHRMHASTGGGYGSAITYLSQRNGILFVRKNATGWQRCKYAVYLGGNLLKEGIFRWRRGEWDGFRLRIRGLRDGLLRRPLPLAELGLRDG